MEEQADNWLADYAAGEMGKSTDGGDDELPPLRLWNPLSYVLQTWDAWHRYGILPKAGSFNDQDAAWVADMHAITVRYNRHVRALMEADNGEPRDLDIDDPILSVGATDWRSYMGD